MNKLSMLAILLLANVYVYAQINVKEVERIEKTLSSDEMQGRRTFTEGIDKAAEFIANEFKVAGIKPLDGDNDYFQEIKMLKPKFLGATSTADGNPVAEDKVIAFTSKESLQLNEKSGFKIERVMAGDTLTAKAFRALRSGTDMLVIVDTAFAKSFSQLLRFKNREMQAQKSSVVFLLSPEVPKEFSFEIRHSFQERFLKNVVGMIKGKSRPDEFVVFSGHYDHLGIGKPNAEGDSIFNGANDDAAGTTAVILLAHHFAKNGAQERSLIFVAFTAEESGGFGSQHFSTQLDPQKVMAMFNIEMIGTESKWGKNSAYITGYEHTDFGKILEKNLQGTGFTFYPDPYPEQNLFYRSDNATLARLGVPAHTISTSKMDSEKFYHTQNDEIETLDMQNMTEIIKAIALSSQSIINGKDTPSRVDTSKVRR